MAGLSFYLDGVPLNSPLLSPCNGLSIPRLADPESELRRLFDQISTTIAGDSWLESRGFESLCSDLIERWVQRSLDEGGEGSPCDRRFSLCPDLRRRIEALIHERLSERMDRSKKAGSLGSPPGSSGSRKRKRYLEDMLTQVRAFAVDPCGGTTGGGGGGGDGVGEGGEQWGKELLGARRTLYLSTAEFSNVKDFPSYPLVLFLLFAKVSSVDLSRNISTS